jgi:fatty-acyl-CoA synthase
LVPGLIVLDRLIGAHTATEPPPYQPDDLALVDFTSGSTSLPQLVCQSFRTRQALIDRLTASATGPATLLSVTPISHTTAPMVDATLAGGGIVVLHRGFDAQDVLDAVRELGITDIYLAVPHLYALLDHPTIADADVAGLRRVIYSGTPAATARIARAVEVFGDALTQVYGTTETGGISSLTDWDHREPELLGSVGRPFPWVDVRLCSPGSEVEVERGQAGEVHVRSDTVMTGYFDEAPPPEGWHRTGDLALIDRYGYLRLVGRVGNVIKSGGLKLDPAAIERALLEHPAVHDAVVFAVRNRDLVEHVHAAVQRRPGVRCRREDLCAHVADVLSPAHAPASIAWWDTIPLNASGKPDLARLRTGRGAR